MVRATAFAVALLVAVSGWAYANETATNPDIVNGNEGWITHDRTDVLLIRTTNVAINQALNELGVAFDEYYGDDFSGLDLSGYVHVILAMDGGLVGDASIANAAGFAAGGGYFHIYGGTCWQDYAIAMNTHLLENNVNDYCWTTVYGYPHSTILIPGAYLACGLPPTYDFFDISATYYQMRETDAASTDVAVNGDGYNHLLYKPIGAGMFDICTNSSYAMYYNYPSDFEWLKQVVSNMIFMPPTPADETTWGSIKALYR
jgi:hypothetical protein